MPNPSTSPETRSATTLTPAVEAVDRALAAIRPIVTQWRDGLTVIALESELKNYAPDYLTLDQASAADGLQIQEAEQQTVPSVDAITGPMPRWTTGKRHSAEFACWQCPEPGRVNGPGATSRRIGSGRGEATHPGAGRGAPCSEPRDG